MSALDDVISAIRARAEHPVDEREAASIATTLAELLRLGDPTNEHADPVHLTGSAVITGERGVILLKHKKLGIWVQPGGHIDPGETPAQATEREACEETGLDVVLVSDELIHVDVHPGPRGHTHLDLRYRCTTAPIDPAPAGDETKECYWFSWPDAIAIADPGLRGLLVMLAEE